MKATIEKTGAFLGCSSVVGFAVFLMVRDVEQNIVTWILWTILEALILFSSISAGKKIPWLPGAYMIGAFIVTIILFSRGIWKFGTVELVTAIGCTIAMIFWFRLGPKWAIMSATIAMVVAGIPSLFDVITKPNPESWWFWGGCALAGLLSLIGAKKWSIEERFMPAASFFYNLVMFLVVIR